MLMRRSAQIFPHHNLQTFACAHINRNLSTHQSKKLESFPPNSPNTNTLQSHFNLQGMSLRGLHIYVKEYDVLLNEFMNQKSLRGCQMVQAHMIKTRYIQHVYLGGRLIVLYLKCGFLDDARTVFDEMPQRNVVSWTAMISGFTKNGNYYEALHLFVQMLRSGTNPNEFTFATVLTSCTSVFRFEYGRQIHSLIVKSPFESHLYVGSSLLDLYAKSGNPHEARAVFEGLPERDTVSCTAIISGYAQQGLDKEALDLFCKLRREGMSFNHVTFACVLTAMSGLAAFEYGRQVHGHVVRSKQSFYTVLQNSLIDMYSKCGHLVYARRIFDMLPERTVISWNAMLGGYSKHGVGKSLVDLYDKMREENEVNADSTTLVTVLSGCSHGGMEHIGLKIFDEVSVKCEVDLGIEHYGCVVDLLGRAGQLERAVQFIKEMPFQPNAAIWGSLLGACRAHRNFRVGKIAGDHLLALEPENAGNYVMVCNLYACYGRWDEVRKVRQVMKEKAVMKEPGRSWIEFGQRIHTFYAGDESDPEVRKVEEMLNEIKAVGYSPDVSCVVYDVDKEQKEKILLLHSEKLALAFGVMNVSESKPIRIMKNLRICVDCHSFAKFVSQVYTRELLIRDKSRFHHIVNGICSCGDYW